jgi:4-amino-4-deoxy-L-arabinose transferase-like glycosyltransferase
MKTKNAVAAEPNAKPWPIILAVLAILLVALTWYPLVRLPAKYEFGPNEGFNSYFQQAAASGQRVYGEPPRFTYANYPPLSFHLVGIIGRVTGDINVAGRWVSVIAYVLIGVFIGLSVERLTGSRRYGAYCALCWLIWLAAFDVNRIGFNDPHLLGIALNIAAFYCFLRDPESSKWLRISALIFGLSLFTKQTLLAFPAAIAIHLFLAGKKRFWVWTTALAATGIVLFVLTWVVDGGYFLDHLMLSREFSFADLVTSTVSYLTFIQVAFVTSILWMLRAPAGGTSRLLMWSFAIAYVLGSWATGGNGAGVNHFFDAMIATAMIAGMVLPWLEKMAADSRFPRTALIVLLIVPLFLSSFLVLPQRIPMDLIRNERGKAALEAEFQNAVQVVRSQPGPALCENLLLCFDAGKPETVDAFAVDQSIKTGHLAEQALLEPVAARRFGVIQIEVGPSETLRPVARHRFSAAFMSQLLANYRLVLRNSRHAIFVPNQPGS